VKRLIKSFFLAQTFQSLPHFCSHFEKHVVIQVKLKYIQVSQQDRHKNINGKTHCEKSVGVVNLFAVCLIRCGWKIYSQAI